MTIHNLNCDTLRFKGHTSGYSDDIHIDSETPNATLVLDFDKTKIEKIKTKDIQNDNGESVFDLSVNTIVDVKKPIKFEGAVNFSGVNVSGLNNISLNSSQILSSNLSGQSGDTSIDAEIDSMITNISNNTNRTSGLTANRILRSNNSGTLQIATFDTADVLRKNDTTNQAITSNLNFASGKKILYNGSQVALTDISGYTALQDEVDVNSAKTGITSSQITSINNLGLKLNKNLDNIGNSVVAVANIHTDIARSSELTAKLNKNLDNIGNSVVPVANIHEDIARGSDLQDKLETNLVNIGNSVVPVANIHADIARSSELTAKLNKNLDNIGNSVVPVANIHTDIARVSAVNTLLNAKLNKNLDNIGSSVVAVANIHTDIARVSAVNTLLNAKVNKSTPTFTGLSNGFAKITNNVLSTSTIADGDLPSTITRDSELGDYLKKDGSVVATGNIQVPQLNITDANHNIIKDGNGDINYVVPNGDIHKFKIGSSLMASVDAGGIDLPSGKVFSIDGNTITGISTSQASAITANTAKVGITQTQRNHILTNNAKVGITTTQATDITNSYKNTTDIQVAGAKHIYRAKVNTTTVSGGADDWITIAVLPATSSPFFGYTNSTFSILDSNRKCFVKFTVSIIKASHTINVDIFGASKSASGNLGIAQIRVFANSGLFDSNHRQGALIQIFSRHSSATYTIYEHAGGNYIENGFSLIPPQIHSSSQTNYTQVSTGSTISVSSPSGFTTVDSVSLETFQKDYTDDHSDSSYEADFVYRCGANAYFKRRIVLETTAEDIYQTHAKTSSLSNGVFTRLAEIELGKDYGTANTIRLPNNNSRLSIQVNTNDGAALVVGAGNTNCNVWMIGSQYEGSTLDSYGFSCKYMGQGTGNDNSLRLIAANQNSTEKVSYEILQDGKFLIHQEIYKIGSIASGDGLFERMSAIDSSPTWVAITPASGYETGATTAASGRLEYAIVGGKQVFIRGRVIRTGNFDFTNNQVLFVLPSAIRPKYSFYAPLHPQLNAMLYFYGTNQDSSGDVICNSGEDGGFNTHFTTINVNYLLD